MATITIKNMQFYAHHGCFEQEQRVGTHFTVTLTFTYDATKAIESDAIEQAISYLEVYQVVKKEMEQPSHLIEHVAWRIKQAVKKQFTGIDSIHVQLCKLNPPLGGQVEQVFVEL
jgi:dihydroneopterin aldolase